MKICMVHPYVAPAKDSMGAERVLESLTRGLYELGHNVAMLINSRSTNPPAPLVHDIPDDCDIVHFHQWEPETKDYDKLAKGKPWVATIHGGGMEPLYTPWAKLTMGNPHIICVSKFVSDRLNCPANVWTCSHPSDFTFREKKDDYFLFMAGLDWGEGKGLFTTIQLSKTMRIKLKIAGPGSWQMVEHVKSLCDDKIEYVGSVNGSEKAKLLSGAKALVLLTQLADACPTTVSEAMLSGTPVIGSMNGAMPELIQEGVNGFKCSSFPEFARAIANIGKISPKICHDIGKESFSHIAAAKKYVQYYNNMLKYKNVIGE